MLHAKGLNDRLMREGSRVRAYSAHPGVVRTELLRYTDSIFVTLTVPLQWIMMKAPLEGAQTSLFLCLAPDSELSPGDFYADCAKQPVRSAPGLWSAGNAMAFTEAVERMMRSGEPMDTVPGTVVMP
jgi:hypothetical protein